MATLCPAGPTCGPVSRRFIEIGISGHLPKTGTTCHLSVCVPFDPQVDRLPVDFEFAPEMLTARGGPWLQEYVCSGYSEETVLPRARGEGNLIYPVSSLDGSPPRWKGRVVLKKVGGLGELVLGNLDYRVIMQSRPGTTWRGRVMHGFSATAVAREVPSDGISDWKGNTMFAKPAT